MSEDEFNAQKQRKIDIAIAIAEKNKDLISAARMERHKSKQQKRKQREQALANKQLSLPAKKYGVIYADPEWQFEFWSELGRTNSSADNHYPTSELEVIKNRDVGSIAAPDSALFLWATVPMLPQAIEVLQAWGFVYKSHFMWHKDKHGTGYWSRNQHELLLIGTRGKIPAPAEGDQWPSVITAPVGKHSAKPSRFYELIESYFPNLPKIELNARAIRPGWDAWGLEVPEETGAAA
jgi:N6-adenosine-specific RNA methylase IME4